MWYNHSMCDTKLTTEKILPALPAPLLAWYRQNARDLPWRRTADPYRIWVSEIMLQQTRVAAVLGYYARFLAAFPSVEALAAAPEDRLMKLWEGLGYYSRARNLQKTARIVAERGAFPDTFQGLLALPGIGEYTAGAIASAAFGAREAAVDGNVLRIFTRLTDCHDDIADPRVKRTVRDALQAVMPETAEDIRIFNQATMELGATVCVPNGPPRCEACPVRELCWVNYIITLEYDAGAPVGAENAIRALLSRESLVVTKKSKKAKSGQVQVDLIPLIHKVDYEGRRDAIVLDVVLRAQNPGLNPALLVETIQEQCPEAAPDYVSYHRKQVLDKDFHPFL